MFKNTRNPQKEKNKIKVHVNIWLSRGRDNKCIQRIKYMRRAGTPQFSAGSHFLKKWQERRSILSSFMKKVPGTFSRKILTKSFPRGRRKSSFHKKGGLVAIEMYCARVQQVVFPFWFFGDSALSWTVVFF